MFDESEEEEVAGTRGAAKGGGRQCVGLGTREEC